jgi:hypothetical protein
MDLFVVPTISFQLLYGLLILCTGNDPASNIADLDALAGRQICAEAAGHRPTRLATHANPRIRKRIAISWSDRGSSRT